MMCAGKRQTIWWPFIVRFTKVLIIIIIIIINIQPYDEMFQFLSNLTRFLDF